MFMIDLGAESYYSFLGLLPNAAQREVVDARDKMYFDTEAKRRDTSDPEEQRRLEDKLKEIGQKGDTLARPDARAEYDRANAHLRFFVLQPAAAAMFLDRPDRLYALDRIVREFLAAKGVSVEPLCDLDREDFSADETPMEMLEQLLG